MLLGALAAGCGSSSGGSRYSISQDRAPARAIDPESIPDVVPEPVIRTGAGNRSPYTVLGRTYTVLPTEAGYSARGLASWYGEKFHGHKTSNGEIFDMYKVSAAHKSLPIPSFLRVTNLDNNRSIVVRVNDRGPFHGDRIIDLSYAAAVKLGYADRGTARVRLEAIAGDALRAPAAAGKPAAARNPVARASGTASGRSARSAAVAPGRAANPAVERMAAELARVETAAAPANGGLYLQVGAFHALGSAEDLSRRVRAFTARPVFIRDVKLEGRDMLYRVRVGPVGGPEEARRLTLLLVAAGLGSPYTVAEH